MARGPTVQGTRVRGVRRVRGKRLRMGKEWYYNRTHWCWLHRGGKKIMAWYDREGDQWFTRGGWKKQ